VTDDVLTERPATRVSHPSTEPDAVLEHLAPGTHVIVPLAAGEPVTVVDAIQRAAERLDHVTIHQMHGLYDRPFLHGEHPGCLTYTSYFLSHITRKAYQQGTCDLVPCHFSEVPMLLRRLSGPKLVVAAASPMDGHGYFSLGTNADYVASFVGEVPFFLEANAQMPRTFGRNQIHVSQTVGWTEADYPLVEVQPVAPNEIDRRIADLIAERIPNGATIQAGIGSIPNAVFERLADHRDLGIHTELFHDARVDLIEAGVVTGRRKALHRDKHVFTNAMGTPALYDFLHDNPSVESYPVSHTNDPSVVAQLDNFISINSILEVDLTGQCNAEALAGEQYSGTGGQVDFVRGAFQSRGGKSFLAFYATAANGQVSRVVPRLEPGAIVTTSRMDTEYLVTEYGLTNLKGKSVRERALSIIDLAHPRFRDDLLKAAQEEHLV
jgi:acyl-CoA hydrolase